MKKRKINKAKQVGRSCSNHGSCPHCRRSRLHQAQKAMVSASQQEEYDDNGWYEDDYYNDGDWDGVPKKDYGWDIDVAQYKMEDR